MGLSEWPSAWKDGGGDRPGETVEVEFDEMMLVAVKTDKAVGLADDEGEPVELWIPISLIKSMEPSQGDWVGAVEVPKWFADREGLEYD